METQIVFRAYNTKRQNPVKLSPLEDKTGKLFTGQGKYGYFDLLTEDEKKGLPMVIDHSTVIALNNGDNLNLNDPIDAANWIWMQKHPYIALDREEGEGSLDAVFYVDNPEREAEVHISRDKKITMAKAKVYAASSEKKVKLARALGNPGAETLSINMLEDWFVNKIESVHEMPETIIKLLDTKNSAKMTALILFEDLKLHSLVTRHAGTWRFGGNEGVPIGNDNEGVVTYILDKVNEEQVYLMTEQLKIKKQEN